MWIQVRTMDGRETHRVDNLSKLTKVDELRIKIMELFKVEPERQRLFYRGKQVGQQVNVKDPNYSQLHPKCKVYCIVTLLKICFCLLADGGRPHHI